jgi:hypothetical protein
MSGIYLKDKLNKLIKNLYLHVCRWGFLFLKYYRGAL